MILLLLSISRHIDSGVRIVVASEPLWGIGSRAGSRL
jgi:hypothetical protein